MASTPERRWAVQGRPVTATRRVDTQLKLERNTYQTWEGFGGGVSEAGWEALMSLKGTDRVRLIRALFSPDEGLRLLLARTPVGASNLAGEPYSLNDAAGDWMMKQFSIERDRGHLLPFLRLPLERIRKFKVVACPWSPPGWMKEPAGDGGAGRMIWSRMMLDAYALYLARYVEEYRREGVTIDHLLVQNEPGMKAQRRPGCFWTGSHLRDFIRSHLGPVFAQRRLATKLWLGALDAEHYSDFTLTVLSDPLAAQLVSGVACQRAARETLARIRGAFPDLPLMQSDCGDGDGRNTWEQAQATFKLLQEAIVSGASICLYDNMVFTAGAHDLEGRGRNSLISVDAERKSFTLTPDYYVIKHFSFLTDRWAVRLGLSGEWSDRAVAFYNDSDETRVVVIANPDGEAKRVVLEDEGERRFVLALQPRSVNTVVL